jgi:hypothetical protein
MPATMTSNRALGTAFSCFSNDVIFHLLVLSCVLVSCYDDHTAVRQMNHVNQYKDNALAVFLLVGLGGELLASLPLASVPTWAPPSTRRNYGTTRMYANYRYDTTYVRTLCRQHGPAKNEQLLV